MAKGKAIKWDEEDLDALVAVSDADIERAAVMWENKAPEDFKDILYAEPVNDATPE